MSNTITDLKTARALVQYETGRNKIVYSNYIAANAVTLDTVSAHVKALQELAFPRFDSKTDDDETKYARKSFGNRVRNGLNTHLGKVVPSKREETASTGQEDVQDGAETPDVATVAVTPVGAFLAAVEAFHAAGYSLSDARAVLADVYGSADRVAA